jgi:hypothetical protein
MYLRVKLNAHRLGVASFSLLVFCFACNYDRIAGFFEVSCELLLMTLNHPFFNCQNEEVPLAQVVVDQRKK